MKRIVLLSLMVMCLSIAGMAQSFDDDLYYTPKNKKTTDTEEQITIRTDEVRTANPSQTQVVVPSGTTVVVKDRQGKVRDVDEYNRRYTSSDTDFSMEGDTLVVQEKGYADRGEWVNGFNGSEDDYEYATRLVRFRSPRYAIPVSSPLYWDVVYGANSWDWNVYDDGFYAYAFPTYTNRLWWDWRFGSFGVTWGFPYYSGYWGWGGYYPGYWGWGGYYPGYWGHHHGWYDPWYGHSGGYRRSVYYNDRRNTYNSTDRNLNRTSVGSYSRPNGNNRVSGATRPSSGRVVGTRTPSTATGNSTGGIGNGTRYERVTGGRQTNSSSRGSYTRSNNGSGSTVRSSSNSSSRRNSTYTPAESSTRRSSSGYNRGGNSSSSRSSSNYNSSRSSSRSSSSRSYSSPSSSYSRSGSSSSSSRYSGGGGSRSGGGSSRSSGGRR